MNPPAMQYAKFQRRFHAPVFTSRSTLPSREGIILRARQGDEWRYGEASPLPSWSSETLGDVETALRLHPDKLRQALAGRTDGLPSALQFAVDCIRLSQQPSGSKIFLHGLIPVLPPEETKARLALLAKRGFRTLQVKLSPKNVDWLPPLLNEYAKDIAFRMDANESLTIGMSKEFLAQLNFHPEYFEDPASNAESEEFPATLAKDLAAGTLPPEDKRTILVFKPTVRGGLQEALSLQSLYPKLVLSSSLESELGLWCLRCFALSFMPPLSTHGLATAELFSESLLEDAPEFSSTVMPEPLQNWLGRLNWIDV